MLFLSQELGKIQQFAERRKGSLRSTSGSCSAIDMIQLLLPFHCVCRILRQVVICRKHYHRKSAPICSSYSLRSRPHTTLRYPLHHVMRGIARRLSPSKTGLL